VLVGAEDVLLPVHYSKELAQGIKGAKLVILEKTGHGLLIETPDEVTMAMLDFLAGIDQRQPPTATLRILACHRGQHQAVVHFVSDGEISIQISLLGCKWDAQRLINRLTN
jgi:hypothetical protein